MLRRLAALALFGGILATPAAGAERDVLVPGVTYEKQVSLTRHGPVVVHVITAPRPGGQYELRPLLSNASIPDLERLTLMQRRVAGTAAVVGVSGDARLTGGFVEGGVLHTLPDRGRSLVGVDAQGNLRAEKIAVYGTWTGKGQRRPNLALNLAVTRNGFTLFTRAWGAATPPAPGSFEVVLAPLAPSTPNAELSAPAEGGRPGGGTPIPENGAVLVARGTGAAQLAAEAPVGATVTIRLLTGAWPGIVSGIGGGPLLVSRGKPVFRVSEEFSLNELALRQARTAIGQRADGRMLLVAVDGRQPGYSTGLSNAELAKTMARLGAVTAAGLSIGETATMAFDGRLLSRPGPSGERPVADGLAVWYSGSRRAPSR